MSQMGESSFEQFLSGVFDKMEEQGLGKTMLVRHRSGTVGRVIQVDPVGKGCATRKAGEPTYLVITSSGQRIWWYQKNCEVLK